MVMNNAKILVYVACTNVVKVRKMNHLMNNGGYLLLNKKNEYVNIAFELEF